jgi:outer membrane protein assembly factor BamB
MAGVCLAFVVAACQSTSQAASTGRLSRSGATSPGTSAPRAGSPSSTSLDSTDWTVYHRYATGSGEGPRRLDLSHLRRAWTSPRLDGSLYGEPLVYEHDVYVATENDTVYALSAVHGTVVWRVHLGTPVPSGDLPCGNIEPTVGITGTPVIDTARNELFVVADEYSPSTRALHHELYGLDTATGAVMMRQNADPPGVDRAGTAGALLQRVSLALDATSVLIGYGGNYGDCGPYHGWLESVPVTGGTARFFGPDRGPGEREGAIWMGGGAPVVRNGDIWVAVGNGSVTSAAGPYDDSDSVLELSPSLRLLQFFAPARWYADNAVDADLGSSVPAVLGDGFVVQAGKSQTAYLLDGTRLGGIGHPLDAISGFCGNDVDGGVAFSGTTVYLPCESGVVAVAVNATSRTIRQLWRTSAAGGPPVLGGGYLWTIGGGALYALDPATGQVRQREVIGGAATDFPTPSIGDGLVLAPSSDEVHAFAGS